ncbi:helix-turn-helix domain-containing protein [Tabrizicola sp. M-4]|uniref:helix-turn-helix domain-containing protein n=1 Tax=Tabrizicola sp. M-4 TaxID=3055847 RepID=UPI003DA99B2C
MKLNRQSVLEDIASPPSLYDAAEEAEPWFLPPDDPVDDLPPLPRSERGRIFDPADWFAAQGALSGDLAAAVLVQGRLAERMAGAGEGARLRLALEEVAELGWWTGARFGMERLALYVALRVGAGEDGLALGQAAWAVRRLTAGAEPGAGGWRAGLAAFLGFEGEAVDSLAEVMAGTEALHPLTRAALLLHGWGLAGENRAARELEAAVLAARHGAQGAPFLPLALAGGTALRGQGPAEARLAAFYRGAEQAGLAALMLLDRVALWQRKADTALADLSGKTPRALVEVFARWPMVSAPMAEEHTQASRAAVQRNLDLMTQRGVIREITGQGRYRVWTAQL